jgi:hypothetical protein
MSLSAPTVIIRGASVTKVLTAAETRALNTTAITVVPAPGAGMVLVPREFILSKGAGTVGASGGNVTFRFGTSSITANLGRSVLFVAAERTYHVTPAANIRLQVNTSINIHMATADMTGNDVPLAVTVIYNVVSTQ